MKKNYAKKFKAYKNIKQYSLLALMLMAFGFYSYGQSVVPFSSRANYSVKGDFTIIGNTNLAPANSSGNDTGDMFFVDVDNDSNTVNSSAATLQLKDDNGIVADDCGNIVYAGLYWTGRPGPDQTFTVPGNNGIPKTLNKSVVSISGPASSGYTNITANASDIYYPESEYANMYIAYADVTSYVQQNGAGEYAVADIALVEGQENPTVTNIGVGYFGGWSMVIVYENSTMKMRNIGVFDGYSFKGVPGDPGYETNTHIDLDISNLNTGDYVNAQIGVMAGEGDDDLSGDLLSTQWGGTGIYRERLTHPGNTQFNFFNSTIEVGGSPRNPSVATYGLDLSKFDLPTASVVPNQDDLSFEYISVLDKFVIYNLTLSFEAPAPGIEAEVAITNINGTPNSSETTTVEPGQDITYTVDIKNFGTEGSSNNMLSIPVPYNTTFSNIVSSNGNGTPTYNSSTNTIDWSLGNIPQQTNTDNVVATVTFTVTTTTDCTLLVVDCANSIALNGTISGTGSVSGTSFDKSLITGYETATGCLGTPIPAPIYTTIVNANCANTPLVQTFEYCAPPVPFTDVSSTYPQGTRFYNEYPVTSNSTEYTSSNPFPTTSGANSYYAVPANSEDCSFEFIIDISPISTLPVVPTDPIVYCLDATAVPLTATATDPSYTLYYYNDNSETAQAFTSITPNTDVAGTTTYYVAEGPTNSPECIGDKVAITVTVNDLLDIQTAITNASCAVGGDGAIDITVTGGSGNYTYLWSTAATTEDITNLVPGVYSVDVTDADFGCVTTLDNITVLEDQSTPTLTAPPAYTLEGCDVSAITDLPVSSTPVSLTIDQLQTAGGTADEFLTLTYVDVVLGTCPTVVTRTFTATNNCNNAISATQTITIEDTQAPVVPLAPADITIECDDALPTMINLTATDNCGANPTITVTGVDTTDSSDPCSVITTRTWTFTDDCGNTSSTSQIITIIDETAPIAPANLADITVACIEDIPAPIALTAIDNCSGVVPGVLTESTLPTDSCNASIIRTWTFADDCGNTSVTTQTVNIIDDIAPVITNEPQDIVYQCDGEQRIPQIDAWVALNGFALANDNCSDVTWTNNYDATTLGCNGAVTVEFTATDACGNATTRSATYTVLDTTGPEIVSNSQDISIVCGDATNPDLIDWLGTNGGAVAQDICSETTWTNDYDANSLNGGSDVTVTFTATDECGNSSTTTSTIIITDSTAPVAPAAPADVTVECIDDVPAMEALTAVDNCAGNITSPGTESIDNTDTCNVIITRTWSFSDASGNTSEVSQIITVNDQTAPVADSVPADMTLDCNANVPPMEALTATDNCAGTITAAGTEVMDTTNPLQTIITRTWTFTDTCGNTSEVSQIISFNLDETAPVVDNTPADLTVECIDDVPAMEALTATDNCSGIITSNGVESINDTDSCNVIITRTWTFTDASGNTTETSQIITVIDTTAPVVPTLPADVTVDTAAEVPPMVDLTATDNCGADVIATPVDATEVIDACTTVITRTWSFEDACGNLSTGSQIITISDMTPPELISEAQDIVYECDGEQRNVTIDAWVSLNGFALAEDAISDVTWTNNYDPDYESCNEDVVVIFTATDECGNSVSTSATYTIKDETGPFIQTAPQDLVFECSENSDSAISDWLSSNGGAVATDFCSDVTWSNDFNASTVDLGACGPNDSITVTFSATDFCGNVTTTTSTITVIDETAPVVPTNVPADVAVECYEDVPATIELTATDNCSSDVTVSGVDTEDNTDPNNIIITRTWTFTDACGNTSDVSQIITVQDLSAPVVDGTVPADVTLECIADVPAMEPLTATDNCAGVITSNGTETINDTDACNVIITRTWSFADASGNTTDVSQIITVNDTTAPIVNNAPQDLVVECTDGTDVPPMGPLTATDNCAGEISAEGTEVIDDSNPLQTVITRTWSFADACGNTTEVSQTITVGDSTAPVVDNAPSDATYACIDDVPELAPLTATDNCVGEITDNGTETINDADTCNVIITRTWMFTDASNNSTTVTQVITVIDDVAPIATAPADVTVECTDDIPAMIDLIATDNCGDTITSTGVDTVNDIDSCSSIITRTWSFTDACGNTASVSQIITVADVTAPVLVGNLETDITVNCTAIPETPELDFTDNCSATVDVVYTEENTSTGAAYENYQIIRDWTVSDSCGNTAMYTQTINVNVQQAPIVESDTRCTEGGSVDLDSYLVDPDTDGTWTVDSGNATINGSIFNPIDVAVGTYVFTFTEADTCQNETTVTIDVNEDCVEPTCEPIISSSVTPNGDQWNEYFTVTGLDRCGFVIDVEIYNRWGSLVFKAQDYQNNWNGRNSKGGFGSSDILPTGTYYYIVTLKNSGLKPLTGPIYLGTK
ncbi:HYR-like domain-containing protein [Formosa sp. 4Alg 33]|uniref:HYR-like domain-containing protein n=1 Tax=Formosa sp. 4Alg 33 TaxID=3382189 RepID=UPI003D9C0394